MAPPGLLGLVLAGGQSTRLGTDKAAVTVAGVPLLERTLALLDGLVESTRVAIRPEQAGDDLRRRHATLVDPPGVHGPAAGLLAAHAAAPDRAWLVVACDMPRLHRELLVALVAARDPTRAGTAYRTGPDGGPEPLCAIYEPATLARLAGMAARDPDGSGLPGPRALLGADAKLLDPPRSLDLASVNTPGDLARLAGHGP